MPDVAVVGAGAAAYGVLLALIESDADCRITLVNPSRNRAVTKGTTRRPDWDEDALRSFYRDLRRQGLAFPPPKTSFGARPGRRPVAGWGSLWTTDLVGGLTEFWGLSCIPFDADDFAGWPAGVKEFAPHYEAVTRAIGVAPTLASPVVAADGMTRAAPLIGETVKSAIGPLGCIHRTNEYEIEAAPAFLALETRPSEAKACISCGHCMIGCARGAMFSAGNAIDDWLRAGKIARFIEGRVVHINRTARALTIKDAARSIAKETFDAIFICAGALGSAEIALRSFEELPHVDVTDNTVSTFPIFTASRYSGDAHLALTSALLLCRPRKGHLPKGQVQLYSAFDHLWRFYVPPWAWPMIAPFGRWLRRHLLIGRLFLDGNVSQGYRLALAPDGTAKLALLRAPAPAAAKPILNALRDIYGRASVIPSLNRRQKTSSHYLGGMPLGGPIISRDGAAADGVYFTDGVTFPSAPASSPTLTIMANGHRIASGWIASQAHRCNVPRPMTEPRRSGD